MRRRTINRFAKIIVTWMVVLMLTVNTAPACHAIRFWRHAYCAPRPVYCGPVVHRHYVVHDPCGSVVYDGCGSEPARKKPKSTSGSKPTPHQQRMEPKTEQLPADQAPSLPAEPDRPADTTPVPDPPPVIPTDEDSPPSFEAPTDLPPPTTDEPTEPSDLDDLFQDTPDAAAPADEARDELMDDLFNETPEPSDETPAAEEPSDALDDLFNAAPDTPAEQPADVAPSDGLDDLFNETPAPGEGEAAPPAADEPADTLDDLFGETLEPAEPADVSPDTPADDDTDSLDDLFGDSAETADELPAMPEDDQGLDSLFDETPATPADSDSGDSLDDSLDDLFGGEEAPAPAEAAEPSTESPAEPSLDDDLDDLFGDSAAAKVPVRVDSTASHSATDGVKEMGPRDATQHVSTSVIKPVSDRTVEVSTPIAKAALDENQLPMRQWTDNTGTFNTTARLAVVTDGYVRLLKDNGRFATVPLRRLSVADMEYVRQHASHHDDGPLVELAGR